ncbi:MAG TPA: hypothetical protein P5132_08685, partial [Bacteroidales bacterium]|nr:hypothetical protein [Bacteroidales bacterium]
MFNFLVNHLWFSYLLFLFYSLLVLSLARKTVIPNFLLRLLPGQSKRIVYYLLYLDYIKAKDNSAITYFFKKDSKSSKNPCIYNNDAFTFWKEIYECYPEILIYYLNRSKILLNDLKLIIPLVYQKGDPTRKNAILLKMIIEKAQIWATVDS